MKFSKRLFDKVRRGQLSAAQTLAIKNTEQRRVAFARLDKAKMKELKGKTLDLQIAAYGNEMQVVEFTATTLKTPLKYFVCVCPSTGRQYYIGTKEETCDAAKAACWGLNELEINYMKEW